jgi:single-stranded DNA-specific DHH superfamily exonuclease
MDSQTQNAEQTNGAAVDESQNVDRIRDILFGSQMRDYDGRFQRLEERLAQDAAEVRADLQRRLEALENFMKGEVESMSTRLRGENAERNQALGKLAHDLAETARGLELKLTNLDNQAAQDIRDLRQQLLEQSKALSNEMKERHEQMKAGLEHEAQQVRGAMTGREALAEMLSEVSLRLKNEFKVPGAQ